MRLLLARRRRRPAKRPLCWRRTADVVLVVLVCIGCAEDGPYRKEVVPVTGMVLVDGKPPRSPIQINCHSLGAPDPEHPTSSKGQADARGIFQLSTYESGDGVPAGEYVLTFEMGRMNTISMSYSGDTFQGKYADPQKSSVRFKAEAGKPVDLGTIELSTR